MIDGGPLLTRAGELGQDDCARRPHQRYHIKYTTPAATKCHARVPCAAAGASTPDRRKQAPPARPISFVTPPPGASRACRRYGTESARYAATAATCRWWSAAGMTLPAYAWPLHTARPQPAATHPCAPIAACSSRTTCGARSMGCPGWHQRPSFPRFRRRVPSGCGTTIARPSLHTGLGPQAQQTRGSAHARSLTRPPSLQEAASRRVPQGRGRIPAVYAQPRPAGVPRLPRSACVQAREARGGGGPDGRRRPRAVPDLAGRCPPAPLQACVEGRSRGLRPVTSACRDEGGRVPHPAGNPNGLQPPPTLGFPGDDAPRECHGRRGCGPRGLRGPHKRGHPAPSRLPRGRPPPPR